MVTETWCQFGIIVSASNWQGEKALFVCVSLFRKQRPPFVRGVGASPHPWYPPLRVGRLALLGIAAPPSRCRRTPCVKAYGPGAWHCGVVPQRVADPTTRGEQQTPFPHAEGGGLVAGKTCTALAIKPHRQSSESDAQASRSLHGNTTDLA